MSETDPGDDPSLPLSQLERVVATCNRFEAAWRAGQRPRVEDFLGEVPETERPELLCELLLLELELRRARGERPTADEYRARFPSDDALIDDVFREAPEPHPDAPPRPRRRASAPDPAREAGLNLLFGILALQNNFIDRDMLLAAFAVWVAEKPRPLGQILVDRGALDDARRALLEALVGEHLKRHGGDPAASLAAVSSLGSVREDLEELADPDLQASLSTASSRAAGAGNDAEATSSYTSSSSRRAGTRFRILRPHAQGGLGQISVALDEELHREVALKELQARHAADATSRSRFVLEAEITGGLEHPGIVPVYGLGHYDDGRPFYAMRFIKGDSLKEAIVQFHAADRDPRRDPGERAVALQKLLRRFLDVCNAIEYAHSRGVLHRDLKPGNIMVGKYGETLVVDWGLAKVVGRPESSSGASETTLRPSSASGSAETLRGSAIGTPAYMSPEQAAGDLGRISPRSDVYSLGATLYALLTGKPPVEAPDVGDVLRRVQAGEVVPPRQVDPRVSPALEAICRKAMALRPEDRYSSPRLLTDDIEHWLADEPVAALPEMLLQRVARWGRRHRTWVQAGAGTLLAITAVSVSAAFFINEARRGERTQKLAALTEKNRADQALLQVTEEKQKVLQSKEVIQQQSVRLFFDKGLSLCEQGDASRGILWMAKALELVPAKATELQRLIRINLASWSGEIYPIQAFLAHEKPVRAVVFGPDGKIVLTVSADKAQLWDATTGQPKSAALLPLERVSAAAFSPDGRTVLIGSGDGAARFWDVATGQTRGQPLAHQAEVRAVVYSPDGKTILTLSADTVRLWNAATGELLRALMIPNERVNAAAFSPDGRTVLTGGAGGAQLWDETTGLAKGAPMGHRAQRSLALPEGPVDVPVPRPAPLPTQRNGAQKHDAVPRDRGTSRIQEQSPVLLRAELILAHQRAGLGEIQQPPSTRVELGAPPALGDYGPVRELLRLLPKPLAHQIPSLPGQSAEDRERVPAQHPLQRDERDHPEPRRAPPERLPESSLQSEVLAVAFSPDGKLVLTGSADKTARLWDVATGQPRGAPMRHAGPVQAVAFSPDGEIILTGSEDTARLWDAATGQPSGATLVHHDEVRTVAFSPDAKIILTGSADTARLWDAATGQPRGASMVHRGSTWAGFSPDGKTVVTGSLDSTVRLWDAATGQLRGAPMNHQSGVLDVAFSPDGKIILTGSYDRSARLWDAGTGHPRGAPMVHEGPVSSVAFSPDGKIILTGSYDRSARLWDAATGTSLGPALTHQAVVTLVEFSPDGRTLLSLSGDGRARLWRVVQLLEGPPEIISAWCQWLAGTEIDNGGGIRTLDATDWDWRRRFVREHHGPPSPVDDSLKAKQNWHERCARESANIANHFAVLWHLDRLHPDRPDDVSLLILLADAHAGTGLWSLTIDEYSKAISIMPDDRSLWDRRRKARLHTDDLQGYRRDCGELLDRFARRIDSVEAGQRGWSVPEATEANDLAWACALVPNAVADLSLPVRLAEKAVAADRTHNNLNTLGAVLHRAGRNEEAVQRLQEGIQAYVVPGAGRGPGSIVRLPGGSDYERGDTVYDWLFLAMAHHKLGHVKEARAWLDKATNRIGPPFDRKMSLLVDDQLLELQLLLREAEALIRSKPAE